jgi:membrane-associated phospholipid phosphatase
MVPTSDNSLTAHPMDSPHPAPPVVPSQPGRPPQIRGHPLRSPGLLARWPLIGLLLVVLGGLAFGAIAVSLQTNGPLIQADVPLDNDLHAAALHSSPVIREGMIAGSYMGKEVIVAIGALLALYFIRHRFWPELAMVVVAWAGQGVLWLVLANDFGRPRPVFAVPVWHQMTAPSFPSGHSIAAVMCYGWLAYLLVPRISGRLWKAVVIGLAILVILYVGFSRLFVGDHYLSDVLAGYALGVGWSGFVYTVIERLSQRR